MAILPSFPPPPPPNPTGNSFVHRTFSDYHMYYANVQGNVIFTVTVTAAASVADRWAQQVRAENILNLQFGKAIMPVGVTTQIDAKIMKLSTLQICVGQQVLMYQLLHAESVPDSLRELLLEPAARFFTLRGTDFNRVFAESQHAIEFGTEVIQIRLFLLRRYIDAPLHEITQEYLGYQIPRWTPEIVHSRWGARTLLHRQILLAALDARMCYIFGRLMYGLGVQ